MVGGWVILELVGGVGGRWVVLGWVGGVGVGG